MPNSETMIRLDTTLNRPLNFFDSKDYEIK